MLGTLSIVLAVAAYAAFYVASPGRQSQALAAPRMLLGAGTVLTVAALAVSILATESAVGPVLVITVMMAVGSALAMAGPFLLPEAAAATPRTSRAPAGERVATRPPGVPPKRPPGAGPKRPPGPSPKRPPSTSPDDQPS